MSEPLHRKMRIQDMNKGNVLVVGGAGYIGAAASRALVTSGYIPVTFDNLSSGRRRSVQFGPFVQGDIRDQDNLNSAFQTYKPVAVIHCATSRTFLRGRSEPTDLYSNIALGTLSLLESMRRASVTNFCLITSAALYGATSALTIPEQTATEPLTAYGACHAAIENIVADFGANSELRWISLRLFNVGGADLAAEIGEDHDVEDGLLPLAIDAALGQRAYVPILGSHFATRDGTSLRDYVHVSDAATAISLAVEHLVKNDGYGPYNIGTGQDHSVLEVIRMVEHVSGLKCPIRYEAKRSDEPFALSADPSRAKLELGWDPALSDLETIVKTAFVYRKQLWDVRAQAGVSAVTRQESGDLVHHEAITEIEAPRTGHDELLQKLDEFLKR